MFCIKLFLTIPTSVLYVIKQMKNDSCFLFYKCFKLASVVISIVGYLYTFADLQKYINKYCITECEPYPYCVHNRPSACICTIKEIVTFLYKMKRYGWL